MVRRLPGAVGKVQVVVQEELLPAFDGGADGLCPTGSLVGGECVQDTSARMERTVGRARPGGGADSASVRQLVVQQPVHGFIYPVAKGQIAMGGRYQDCHPGDDFWFLQPAPERDATVEIRCTVPEP